MGLDLAAEAGTLGEEVQGLLDAVLPYQDGVDPALRQVTTTAYGRAFAIEIGTAAAGKAQTIPLLKDGAKVAEMFLLLRLGIRRHRACRRPAADADRAPLPLVMPEPATLLHERAPGVQTDPEAGLSFPRSSDT